MSCILNVPSHRFGLFPRGQRTCHKSLDVSSFPWQVLHQPQAKAKAHFSYMMEYTSQLIPRDPAASGSYSALLHGHIAYTFIHLVEPSL